MSRLRLGAGWRGRRRSLIAAAAVVSAVSLGLPSLAGRGGASTISPSAPWLDSAKSTASRVDALLRAMTLPEKVGQMDQQLVDNVTDPNSATCNSSTFAMPNPACERNYFVDQHVGSVLAGGTDNPPDTTGKGGPGNTGLDWANEYNQIQSYAIQHSRLHIPLIFGVDAVHGFGHPWQAPLFPQSIGMGATWDPAVAQAGGAVTANALRATGWVWAFAPVQDLARDNRWGRTYETWAEEPVLSAAMGAANVKGLQTPKAGALDVSATVKHFAGYSQSINGHDRNEALLPLDYLESMILPSYAGGIDAGAGTVMVDSGSINGIPATASHYLLTDLLRNQMGFQGVVISDYQDVPALQSTYHIVPDLAGAIAKAVNAGVDMSMEVTNPDQWQSAILADVASGKISQARIDQAVRRILTLKFQLGLFDQPCVNNASLPCVNANAADAAVTSGRDMTLKAAQESMTLLRNQNNVLPLPATSKVVVTGPSADSMTNQLGGWSVSWQGVFGAGHVCCMGPANQIPPGTTVQQGIKADDPNAVFASDQATALADAGTASAYVVAVGEKAYAEGLGDNPAPALPPDQQALITALEATGKPVIVVVIAGRPLGLGAAAENANGVLMAYQGSTEAGQAVADAIFGKIDPSGKLSVSWPSDAPAVGADFDGAAPSPLGDQPKVFDQLPSTGSGPGHAYNPLYPFGYGLSYTTFQTSALSVTPNVSANGTATATFTVTNTGALAGTDIVPVYVSQPVSNVVVPPQRLVGFARVGLAQGQSKVVKVSFPASTLAETQGDINGSGPPTVQTGAYMVVLDKNDMTPYDVAQSAPFTVF